MVVGYDRATHRVVTVLPENYMKRLPPEMVSRARLKLVPSEQERVIADILSGKAVLLRQESEVSFYKVQYEGLSVRFGYDSEKNRLLPFRKRTQGNETVS